MLSGLMAPQQLRHLRIGKIMTTPDVVKIRTVKAVKQLMKKKAKKLNPTKTHLMKKP
eukprot:CAMPEP_0182509118 /NCGR_PEP_ID=MMETSP1321-20130603/26274_1 /TAXON_ID=91990 /ORGANISM="Bolidomonas sp., Strain RCC1657" /LENGTH=56 /DNA_ID=CAMNT_0024715337 /DNA_START=749 /DNA_END=919 /DNA_ORIENTATION=-